MKLKKSIVGAVLLVIFYSGFIFGQRANIISPDEFLGFRAGADFKLARWEKIVEYFNLLLDRPTRNSSDFFQHRSRFIPIIQSEQEARRICRLPMRFNQIRRIVIYVIFVEVAYAVDIDPIRMDQQFVEFWISYGIGENRARILRAPL